MWRNFSKSGHTGEIGSERGGGRKGATLASYAGVLVLGSASDRHRSDQFDDQRRQFRKFKKIHLHTFQK